MNFKKKYWRKMTRFYIIYFQKIWRQNKKKQIMFKMSETKRNKLLSFKILKLHNWPKIHIASKMLVSKNVTPIFILRQEVLFLWPRLCENEHSKAIVIYTLYNGLKRWALHFKNNGSFIKNLQWNKSNKCYTHAPLSKRAKFISEILNLKLSSLY